jgi:tetratricopeptide (TPR) repeat protein
MMKKVKALFAVLALSAALAAYAEEPAQPTFSLELTPQLSLPVGRDVGVFSMGGGGSLLGRLPLPIRFLSLEAGAGFEMAPLVVAGGKAVSAANLLLFWPWAGVGFDLELFRNFTIGARVNGGYYFGSLDADVPDNSGRNPMFCAGASVGYRFLPNLSVGIGASYRNFLGLYNDMAVSVGTTYHFLPQRNTMLKLKPYRDLLMEKVDLQPVFPVMYKYYDDHPIGQITLRNSGKIPLEGVKVSVFVNQYMDNPKAAAAIPFVKGGETVIADLYALFNDKVMGISEATKVQASVAVELSVAGENYGNERVETLRIYDRNAITWADDRRVAAFIVAKDPTAMRFAKNVASVIKDRAVGSYDDAFLKALAMHEALRLYGMAYQIDPSSPYSEETKKSGTVDYLQYPSQTLEFKAGDCDDLTILNASLLESLGVETAFITVPGHIYVAFALDASADEAVKRFQRPESLIIQGGKAWVPVEITLTQAGFMKAWDAGAQQWRDNTAKSQAVLSPVHEAWKLYEPVGFTRDLAPVGIPDDHALIDAFTNEMVRFVGRELAPQVAALQEKMKASPNDPKLGNSLGVLYARFGQRDNAEIEFQKVLTRREYAPALSNMGNLAYMAGNMAKARGYFERANKIQPDNPNVLLNLARTCYELGDSKSSAAYFSSLKRLDDALAARFSYLDVPAAGTTTTARAADAERMKSVILWNE